jgi:peroxiredoxin
MSRYDTEKMAQTTDSTDHAAKTLDVPKELSITRERIHVANRLEFVLPRSQKIGLAAN